MLQKGNAIIGYVLAVLVGFLSILVLYDGNPNSVYASHMQVSVTIDKLDNLHSGYIFHCFDPIGIGCGRADFYGVMYFIDKNGNFALCDKTNTIIDIDFPQPGWTCTLNGVSQSPILETPVRLILEIWDFDGGDDYQADLLDFGTGKAFTTVIANGTNQIVTPGDFGTVDVRATMTITGKLMPHVNPTDPSSPSASRPPLTNIYLEYSPMIPVSGESDLIDFNATTRDDKNVDRLTDRIEIWLANNQDIISRSAPTTPAKTCSSVKVCKLDDVPNLTNTPGRFAYKAVAYDTGGEKVETSWRMVTVPSVQHLNSGGGCCPLPPLQAGVNSEPFGLIDSRKAVDVVFFPGTGFSLLSASERTEFSNIVLENYRYFFRPPGSSSTVLTRQNSVNFWINHVPVEVKMSMPGKPQSPDNLCQMGAIDRGHTTFSQINAVLHNVTCRDNASGAPGDTFMAKGKYPSITWHEFHHAAYGLPDEYYRVNLDNNGDRVVVSGLYIQIKPFPSIYSSSNVCAADPLSGGNCRALQSAGSVESNNHWYRFDLDPDVMVDNTVERPADIRRSLWLYDQCQRGFC